MKNKGNIDMPESDYEAIKTIIDDIIGDTNQGVILLNAIRSYFDEKETIQIVKKEIVIKNPDYQFSPVLRNREMPKDAKEAMSRYTSKLNKENEKFRAKYKKANC